MITTGRQSPLRVHKSDYSSMYAGYFNNYDNEGHTDSTVTSPGKI